MDPDAALVISAWYRARLGDLQTKRSYALEVANRWLGKTRASMQHPQNVVRIGIWLGIVSVALGAVGLLLGLTSLRG